MKILAVDTALGKASACIYCSNSGVISFIAIDEYSSQAENLFRIIDECLSESKLAYSDITHFSATIGPGSFTGLRIGLSALKALAFAEKKPFIGITSLEAMYQNADITEICCAINAGRKQVYLQNFPQEKAIAVNFDDIHNHANFPIICNCYDDIKKFIPEDRFHANHNIEYDARNIAEACYKLVTEESNIWQASVNMSDRNSPLYLRAPDAIAKKINRKVIFTT